MKLLIDGDLLVHRSTVAVEHDVCFDDRYHILMSDAVQAYNILEDTLHELGEQAGTNDYKFIFSDPKGNFRKNLSVDYKSDRAGTRKPLAYWATRERCEEDFDHLMLPNLEADDVMGLLLTKYPEEYAIWTLDKDLKQIPGRHLIDDEITEISELEGDRFFWFQIIAGDKVDGYDGCPGIGKVRGERMAAVWQTEAEAWEAITAHYKKAGLTDSDALYNAQMARILRHGEWSKNKGVNLWTPPTN